MERRRIGDLFVERGIITPEERTKILEHGQKAGKAFGEAGLELGLITREEMVKVFGPNFEIDFFYLDSKYFPAVAKDILSLDEILRFGALPLGFKKKNSFLSSKKIANVGFLDPGNDDSVNKVRSILLERLSPEGVSDVKIFLLLSDQFLDVLQNIFGKDKAIIKTLDPSALDRVLALHLRD